MRTYRLDPERIGEVAEALTQRIGHQPRLHAPLRHVYYDTFDWRVFREDSALRATGEKPYDLIWSDRTGRWRHHARVRRLPRFATDLPSGPFKDELGRITDIRRLLPVVGVVHTKREWVVKDTNERLVARMTLTEGMARSPDTGDQRPVRPVLRVRPVRGRKKAAKKVLRSVVGPLALEPSAESDLEAALEAVGRAPDDYSTKLSFAMSPDDRADRTVHRILRFLCGTMLRNEAGVVANLDPEFLHDYRVACRRTRAALSQIRGVVHPETSARFRKAFRSVHRATSHTRDLDVYRIELPRYRTDLPPDVRVWLEPLDRFLEERQRGEHAHVAAILRSPWYRSMMADWRSYVLTLPDPEDGGTRAGHTAGKVARKSIRRAYRRVVRTGAGLGARASAVEMHRLRIECKKLRYVVEFFRSLYPSELVDRPVEDLKAIQDALGEHNDLEVQRQGLRRFAMEMAHEGAAPPQTLVTIGQLVEQLGHRQDAARRTFDKAYRRFRRSDAKKRFKRLLGA